MSKRSLNRPFAKLAQRLAREKAAREKRAKEEAERQQKARELAQREAAARAREAREQAQREMAPRGRNASAPNTSNQVKAEPNTPPAPAGSFAELAQRSRIKPLASLSRRVERVPDIAAALPKPRRQAPTEHYEVEQDQRLIEGRRIDVAASVVDALRRSQPHSRVDLHGMPAEEARRRLHRFILGQHAHGGRLLLVIVGKGLHSPGGHGVLRGEIAGWLSEPKMAPFVLAFVSARREHGGFGALYVQIRR